MKHSTTDYGISMAVLESVSQPVADGRGMPSAVYTDPSLFAFERDHVFGKTWAGLAFADELPRPGYAQPAEFMGLPLAILRDADGEIKVFHNVCSHRGLILLHEESEIHGMIRCRYPSWPYDLGGNLKATPNAGVSQLHPHRNYFGRGSNARRPTTQRPWLSITGNCQKCWCYTSR